MDKLKKWAVILLVLCAVFTIFYWNKKEEKNNVPQSISKPIEKEKKKGIPESRRENMVLVIDIKGAVKNEGVYEMSQGSRVKEAVERAGGFLPEADTAKVNLAQYVQDQMLLFIPRVGDNSGSIVKTQEKKKIAINSATKEEMENIQGIGPRKAESIIRYRDTHGPFRQVEDLLEVDGIGEKSLEKIKEEIIVP